MTYDVTDFFSWGATITDASGTRVLKVAEPPFATIEASSLQDALDKARAKYGRNIIVGERGKLATETR